MEEGRVRPIFNASNQLTNFAFDYMIKDHLGNVRMVLTDEQKPIFYPAATMEGTFSPTGTTQENTMVNYEKQFSSIDNSKIVLESAIPSWPTETVANTKLYYNNNGNPPANSSYPTNCTPTQTAGSNKLYQLNATQNKTGLEFVIKVMAGDKLDIFGKSYYLNTTAITNLNSTTLTLTSLLSNFLLAPANLASTKGATTSILQNINNGVLPNTFFRGNNSEPPTTVPKAYINYIFLDEQFKFAGGGASRVGASGIVKDRWQTDQTLQGIEAPKNGYIFVYVSNESNLNVFFDNLQVIHTPGPILEETHYYPFGLRMESICSKAAGSLENKYQFGGKERQAHEFSDGEGLDYYDFGARNYDPQIGRWFNQDKFAEVYVALTPYQYAANNPIKIIDEAGHLLKDKDGNLIATSTGQTYTRNSTIPGADGNSYRVNSSFKEVVVYTDQGTPVRALQMVSQYVEQEHTDAQGNVSYTPATTTQFDASQNCHGTTFAEGKLVIVDGSTGNESVRTILKEDGYISEGVTIESAVAFMMSFAGDDYHSGKVNKDGTVTSDHDLAKPQTTTLENEKTASSTPEGTATTLYDRKKSDKQVSTKAGKVSNGVRTISQQQATDLRKKNGLNTTNKAKGTFKGTAYEQE